MGLTRVNILVADDRKDDLFFISKAFQKSGRDYDLSTAGDGAEAIEFLKHTKPLPNLVLLDLKMPKLNGFDVLEWIQSKPALQGLTIVVYSSSDLPEDIERAKKLGAKEYFVKCADLKPMVRELESRFLKP